MIIAVVIVGLLFTVITLKSYTEAAIIGETVASNANFKDEGLSLSICENCKSRNGGDQVTEDLEFKENVKVKVFEGIITLISNDSITVESEEFSGQLLAKGRWFFIDGSYIGIKSWVKVYCYIEEGEALIVMASISKDDKTINLLLGLKQEDLALLRPIILKQSIRKYAHTKNYFGIYGTILYKGNNYLLINNRGYRAIVAISENSTWYKAGDGLVTWEEVRGEFNDGDRIRVFCHNILILNKELSKYFGFNAIIWGYSGAIIDLTSGVSITKYVG